MIVTKMLGVGGSQKRALMMGEPPGQLWRAGIFEIHDSVFVAVECAILERLRGLVRHSGIEEFGSGIDALLIEARENRGGGGPVEAFIVEANPDLQFPLLTTPGGMAPRAGESQQRWTFSGPKSRAN